MGNILGRGVFGLEVTLWILVLQPGSVFAWNDHYDKEDGKKKLFLHENIDNVFFLLILMLRKSVKIFFRKKIRF